MKRIVTMMMSAVLVSGATWATALELRGTQIKGTAGRDAQIKSQSVKLTKPAKIIKIEGAPEGLCIQSPAEEPLCGSVKELVGKILKPGSYTTYPNIPNNKDQQSVTVYLQ